MYGLFDEGAQNVSHEEMPLLNKRRSVGRDANFKIAEIRHIAAISSRESNGMDPKLPCRMQGGKDVLGSPRCRNADKHIARVAKSLQLPRECTVESVIIANCSQDRRIRCKGDTGHSGTIIVETGHKLRREMLSIGSTSSVAGEKDLLLAADRSHNNFGCNCHFFDELAVI